MFVLDLLLPLNHMMYILVTLERAMGEIASTKRDYFSPFFGSCELLVFWPSFGIPSFV